MSSDVLVVDENNEVQDRVSREEAHTGDGIRHRAYTILVRDSRDRVLLARRSEGKELWPGYWDGTVASHPVNDGNLLEEAARRLTVELGIDSDQYTDITKVDDFEYKTFYQDGGVEWEICSLLTLELTDETLDPDSSEVSEVSWEPLNEKLIRRIENYSLLVCPWFEIALDIFLDSG